MPKKQGGVGLSFDEKGQLEKLYAGMRTCELLNLKWAFKSDQRGSGVDKPETVAFAQWEIQLIDAELLKRAQGAQAKA